MRPMRLAAVRALGIWFAALAVAVAVQALNGLRSDDASLVLARLAIAVAALVLMLWLASLLVRQPRTFERVSFAAVVMLLAIGASFESWDGSRAARTLRPHERAALEVLADAERFELPLIGFLAVPSDGLRAMQTLAASPRADIAFKQLIRSGTPSGQLYGLIGVRRTHPLYFRFAARGFALRRDAVPVFSGCVIDEQEVASLVRDDIASGALTRAFLDTRYD